MKKLFSLLATVCVAAMAHAGLNLSVNGELIDRDTTITITEVEYEDFTGEAVMGWEGLMFYNGDITVYIERQTPCEEGREDQLCAGMCTTGTVGQTCDTLRCDLKFYPAPIQVYAHYYPEGAAVETIKYRFVGDGDDFTLTVNYDSRATMAVENTESRIQPTKQLMNGRVVIVRGDKVYDLRGALIAK